MIMNIIKNKIRIKQIFVYYSINLKGKCEKTAHIFYTFFFFINFVCDVNSNICVSITYGQKKQEKKREFLLQYNIFKYMREVLFVILALGYTLLVYSSQFRIEKMFLILSVWNAMFSLVCLLIYISIIKISGIFVFEYSKLKFPMCVCVWPFLLWYNILVKKKDVVSCVCTQSKDLIKFFSYKNNFPHYFSKIWIFGE